MKNIIKRSAYSFSGSHRIYRTSYSAGKALAWKMIAEKHQDIMSPGTINYLNYSCECDQDQENYSAGCGLHDKKQGYFKRLSVRLIGIILLRYANS